MIRVVLFLIVVGVLALGEAWLADRPGNVVVTWLGFRIETSLMVMTAAALATLAVLAIVWSIVRAIVRSPAVLAKRRRERRGARAYAAISDGLIAVGSGDIDAARKLAADANRLAPGEPLALLLSAQAAQLSGDRDGAERAFRAMANRADTKALGLHGLFIEAQRRDDAVSARAYAEEAARTTPALGWAGRAVLESRCKDGDWAGALALLEQSRGALDKSSYRRQRAVLLTARALATENSDREVAKAAALEANKLAPTLVPAAALAARLLAEGGYLRKANRIIDTAWRANPHPELAQSHAELRASEAARDRLKRIDALAKRAPENVEGALAVARAAIDAREFARARAALAPYLGAPTKRIAVLTAELERAEGDEGRAREWLGRAVNAAPDPAWTADGYISDRWLPLSPVTGRLDAFAWRVPLTAMTSAAPVIESETVLVIPAKTTTKPAAEPAVHEPHDSDLPLATNGSAAPLHPALQPAQPKAGPVIPLVHAPDDPGPVAEIVDETEPEPDAKPSGWRKIFE
jgi:HemY protein